MQRFFGHRDRKHLKIAVLQGKRNLAQGLQEFQAVRDIWNVQLPETKSEP